ncbi:hypothetical protein SALBM217S_09390 [Streptomyces griseoloalbus]
MPDLLDEARWELEFLLKMQVPDGEPLAGMAHHKIHDEQWTGLPLLPGDDPQKRELRRTRLATRPPPLSTSPPRKRPRGRNRLMTAPF